jgi:hypothetical protein
MTFLTFRGVPRVIEEDKDRNAANISITGFDVAQADLVKAFLSYGTYDKYYFLLTTLEPIEDAKARLTLYPNHERAELIGADNLESIKEQDRMVLFTGSSLIAQLAHLRKVNGQTSWPVVGLTHALSYLAGIQHALLMLLDEFFAYDCLICTSKAGQRALHNVFHQLSSHLDNRLRIETSYNGRLPIILLGTDANHYCPRDKAEASSRLGVPADHTVFLYPRPILIFTKDGSVPASS